MRPWGEPHGPKLKHSYSSALLNPSYIGWEEDTVKARSGNQYVMIAYHADGNLILQQGFKMRNDRHRIAAYNAIMS